MVMQMQLELEHKNKTGVFARRVGNEIHLTGRTWSYKRTFGATGGKWHDVMKVWVFTGELPSVVSQYVEQWLEDTPPAPDAPAEPSTPASVAPAPTGIVKPSYWDLLWLYTTPQRCRPAIALVGPAGNGKTTVAEQVLEMRGIPYLVIDANVSMEPVDLVGGMSYQIENGVGKQVWQDGPVTRAFREGMGVIINEFDSLDPRTALCLQSAFQGKGATKATRYVTLSGNPEEDRVYPNGDCPIILTMNTFGTGATRLYTGRNALDAASRDRMTIINTGYENEDAILVSHGYSRFTAKWLLDWAMVVRHRIDKHELPVILGMRTLLGLAELIEVHGVAYERAVEIEFFSVQDADTAVLLRQD